jgi:hypothetical protein
MISAVNCEPSRVDILTGVNCWKTVNSSAIGTERTAWRYGQCNNKCSLVSGRTDSVGMLDQLSFE